MKPFLFLCVLCVLSRSNSPAADARVITEGGTNILAVGIDSRDFDVIRFYFAGGRTVEFSADELRHNGRAVAKQPPAAVQLERDALLAALAAQTNVGLTDVTMVVSNLARLKLLEENAEKNEREKEKEKVVKALNKTLK